MPLFILFILFWVIKVEIEKKKRGIVQATLGVPQERQNKIKQNNAKRLH